MESVTKAWRCSTSKICESNQIPLLQGTLSAKITTYPKGGPNYDDPKWWGSDI